MSRKPIKRKGSQSPKRSHKIAVKVRPDHPVLAAAIAHPAVPPEVKALVFVEPPTRWERLCSWLSTAMSE